MILQSLVSYYEELSAKGRIPRPGWSNVKISYALEIDGEGRLINILPLKTPSSDGKKMLPRELKLPTPVKRTVGISANFLWDNASYMLGLDSKGDAKRAKRCFEDAYNLHLKLLADCDDAFAKAILGFFSQWIPETAKDDPMIISVADELAKGANLTFMFEGKYPVDNKTLCAAWQEYYDGDDGDGDKMRCLVTGVETVPAATHPPVKGVRDAQSSGAALVSFNAPAYCSYNREQNLNAPVSKYAAFAYTTALNYLLADNDHKKLIGDTTVVYWAENAEPQYQDAFGCFLEGNIMTDVDLKGVMEGLIKGKKVDWNGLPLEPDNHFYVLGLSPNAARVSVRFFLRDTFGAFAENIDKHYVRLEIVKPDYDKDTALPLWKLLRETVNTNAKDKSASPQMAGDTLRAILTGERYPATLYQQTMLRIKAEHDISRGKAAIIKAYLIKNCCYRIEEELMPEETNVAYSLGQLFCVIENVQKAANPNLNTTIKDRYFNAASTNPCVAFPTILRLKNSHIKVISRDKPALANFFENQIAEISNRLGQSFPKYLSLEQQGMFMLGYYQKRYEKKSNENIEEGK